MNKSELVAIRPYSPNDKNFVFSTFLRGLYYGNTMFTAMDKDTFMHSYQTALERLVASPDISVKVACLVDDPEVILGYAISKGSRLDWIFVKKAWRQIGIAKALLPSSVETVTHLTAVGQSILKKHPSVKYNPFALTV